MSVFDHKTHEEWIEKLKKELKTDDLSAKKITLDEHIRFDPFFERIPKDITGSLRAKDWKMIDIFDARSQDSSDILESLNGGINALEIQFTESITDPASFFSGIHLHYVDLHLEYSQSSENKQSMLDYLAGVDSKNKLNVSIADAKSTSHMWHSYRFRSIESEGLVLELTSIFSEIINLIDQAENKDHAINIASKIEISRAISNLIVQEIAIKQAMNLLWKQVCNGFDLELQEPNFQANCIPSEDLELESRYIEQSVKGLSAALAGYDKIYIAPADTEKFSFHKRISRNIHHLLSMESFVQKGNNAFVGSFQIEKMAQQIAESAWKNIGRE